MIKSSPLGPFSGKIPNLGGIFPPNRSPTHRKIDYFLRKSMKRPEKTAYFAMTSSGRGGCVDCSKIEKIVVTRHEEGADKDRQNRYIPYNATRRAGFLLGIALAESFRNH